MNDEASKLHILTTGDAISYGAVGLPYNRKRGGGGGPTLLEHRNDSNPFLSFILFFFFTVST